MDEDFDVGTDTSVDVAASTDVDIEPIDVVSIEEPAIMEELEAPISEQELSELQNEAAALEIQPLDDAIAEEQPSHAEMVRGNLLEAMNAAGEKLNDIGQRPTPSAPGGFIGQLGEIGLATAKPLGQAAAHSIPAFMEATINQHGRSPSVEYNEMLIQQAINEKPHD